MAALGLGALIVQGAAPRLALVTLLLVVVILAWYGFRRMTSARGSGIELFRTLVRTVFLAWGIAALAALVLASVHVAAVIGVGTVCVAGVMIARRRERTQPADPMEVPRSSEVFQQAVTEATDDQLRELWHRSASAIRHSYLPSSVNRYVELRQLILDEAERRDPEQVAQWLAKDPSSDSLGVSSRYGGRSAGPARRLSSRSPAWRAPDKLGRPRR